MSSWSLPIEKGESSDVFNQGSRGQEVRRRKIKGTGTGLYLAKKILKAHNGDLLLTSLKDPVTFEMEVPIPS